MSALSFPALPASVTLPAELVWRMLGPDDLDAIEALHQEAIRGMGVQAVKPEERAFFLGLLTGRGHILGVLRDRRLVAYGVLQHDLLAYDNPCDILGLPLNTPVVKLAGAAVEPDWRGNGLQRVLIEARVSLAGDAGVIFSTAAPANQASWSSLLACGFSVRALQYRYGGHPRFLMVRLSPALNRSAPSAGAAVEVVDSADLARQTELLAMGWWGIAAGPRAGSIQYARPS